MPVALDVRPVDAGRWPDLCDLFGPTGTSRGCWCMAWRLGSTAFAANGNAGNRRALEGLVRTGAQVGLLGYLDGRPVAWCSAAPRPTLPRVLRSTTIAPPAPEDADDPAVWSVVCFFVRAGHRRRGLLDPMLAAAVDLAAAAGANAVEGYPMDTEGGTRAAAIDGGTIALYERHGFAVHRRPDRGRRVVMRRALT